MSYETVREVLQGKYPDQSALVLQNVAMMKQKLCKAE